MLKVRFIFLFQFILLFSMLGSENAIEQDNLMSFIASTQNNILKQFQEARKGDWQFQVLVVEIFICFLLILFIYIAWRIYGENIQELFSQSPGETPNSPSQKRPHCVTHSKKTL